MPYQHILYSVEEHIATITLNRPDVLNAYTPDMGDDIVAAFRVAEKDNNVRAVILTGSGDRGFCAGADRIYLQRPLPEGTRIIGDEELIRTFPLELAHFPKPTIAAINGHAIGIGMTMILPLDIRIAADTAKLALNFARLGIMPGLGSTHLLPKIVGMAKAQELVMTGRTITAQEAFDIGLVNHVLPADALMAKARELALQCTECDPLTQKFAKRAMHYGSSVTLEEAMRNEQNAIPLLREEQEKRQAEKPASTS